MSKSTSLLKHFDFFLFLPMFLLLCYGIVVVRSFSVESARTQTFFALAGLGGYMLLSIVDYKIWQQLATWIYICTSGLLLLTFLVGVVSRGSARWLSVGGAIAFQPSEFAKIAVVIAIAFFLTSRWWVGNNFLSFLLSLAVISIPAGLVFLQPDLGTAILLISIWIILLLGAKVNLAYMLTLGTIGLVSAIPLWSLLHSYQKERILTFFNPTRDPLGTGYHVIQSQIAAGSGMLTGRGYGQGTQSHLQFLPDFKTDFIFAALAEEWGFVGAMLLLLLFGILFYKIFQVAKNTKSSFGFFLTLGVLAMVFVQTAINIGMNLGVMPVTGIPLPLISVGGSSMLATIWALGLVQSVAMRINHNS